MSQTERLPLEASFRQAIDADPRDSVNRLVAADWLEENGRPRSARVQRWIAQWGCYPHRSWDINVYPTRYVDLWVWNRDLFDGRLSVEPWELPDSLFKLLVSQIWTDARQYHEEARAWADLERALWHWKELP